MELDPRGAGRDARGRFRNNYRNTPHNGAPMWQFLRDMRQQKWRKPEFERAENDPAWLARNRSQTSFTWIGHASFLVQFAGLNILTDPVLSARTSPVQWAGPKRLAPLGLEFDQLPRIDLVVISHNHYDHLDSATVQHLAQRDQPAFVVPLGLRRWFARRRIPLVTELDWWQSTLEKGLRVHAVPAQHFSGRSLRDRNQTLWCGFVLEAEGKRIYFAGDTGYGRDFADIGRRFGHMDVSLLPIGAYEPRAFMGPVHVDPEEAVRIHQDVNSRLSLAMHWGTFRLTLEALEEPPQKLREALSARGIAPEQFRVPRHGETLKL